MCVQLENYDFNGALLACRTILLTVSIQYTLYHVVLIRGGSFETRVAYLPNFSNLLSFKNHYQYILDTFTLDSTQTFCGLT